MKNTLFAMLGAVLLLGACSADVADATFAAFSNGLAQVDCTTAPAAVGGVAQNIIKLTVNCPTGTDATSCQTLAKDEANEASAQSLATQFCPAFKGLGNVVIQASIAAIDASKATTKNTIAVPAPSASAKSARKAMPEKGTVSVDPKWTYTVPVS